MMLLTFVLLALGSSNAVLPYKDRALPVDARVADLVSRMTLEEKVNQLFIPWGSTNVRNPQHR